MTSIHFHLRPSSRGREFEGSLFVRVIHQRKALNATTSFRLYPSEWDEQHSCLVYRPEGASRFLYLSGIEKMMVIEKELLYSIVSSLKEQGEFSVTDVVRLYRLRKSGVPMLPFAEKLSNYLTAHGQYRTARAYRTTSHRLARFSGKDCFTLADIRPSLLKEFETDMLEKGKTLNTVSFYMRNLRAIYNRAIRESLVESPKKNPFEGVYTGIEQTKKRALSREDMVLLSRDLLSNNKKEEAKNPKKMEALSSAQRLFLFSFHARGMSFVDVAFLKKSDIRNNNLIYRRRKTGQQLEIIITSEMRHIIDSFSCETKSSSPYVFPIIKHPGENEYRQYETGLKRQNLRLKQLSSHFQLSTLNFQLSTHVSRHTWASLAKELNFPLAVISEALGHTSEKTTSIYLSSFDHRVLDNMNRRISKALKRVG